MNEHSPLRTLLRKKIRTCECNLIMFKISTLESKKHKKISVVFDEGLQRISYNELEDLVEIGKVFICFCKSKIC